MKCVFSGQCMNYLKMCDCCRWNADLEFGDYLELPSDSDTRETVRLLEKQG